MKNLSYEWIRNPKGKLFSNPYEGRFVFTVYQDKQNQRWLVEGHEEEMEESFSTCLEAQIAAEELYDNYYVDFDDVTDGY